MIYPPVRSTDVLTLSYDYVIGRRDVQYRGLVGVGMRHPDSYREVI